MLCSRSASLTMITRTSVVMARNICCRSSAWTFAAAAFAASGVSSAPCLLTLEDTLLTLVSPSTMRRDGFESILDGLEGDRVRVLDGVVKEARDDGLVVHVLVGEYTRDRDGMGHKGLARFSSLAVVRVEGDLDGRVHLRALEVVEVGELVRDAVVQVVGIDVGPVGGAGHLIDRRARGDASASSRRFRGTRRGSSETSHGRARRRERGSRARGGMAVHPTVREVASMRTRGVPRREPREDGPCARHRSTERGRGRELLTFLEVI